VLSGFATKHLTVVVFGSTEQSVLFESRVQWLLVATREHEVAWTCVICCLGLLQLKRTTLRPVIIRFKVINAYVIFTAFILIIDLLHVIILRSNGLQLRLIHKGETLRAQSRPNELVRPLVLLVVPPNFHSSILPLTVRVSFAAIWTLHLLIH